VIYDTVRELRVNKTTREQSVSAKCGFLWSLADLIPCVSRGARVDGTASPRFRFWDTCGVTIAH